MTFESRRQRGLPGIPQLPNLPSTVEAYAHSLFPRQVHSGSCSSALLKKNPLLDNPPKNIRPVDTNHLHLLAETVWNPKRDYCQESSQNVYRKRLHLKLANPVS